MSNRRAIVHLLIAILVVVSVHFILTMRGSQTTALRPRQTLLEGMNSCSGILIERPDRRGVKLVKAPDWRMIEPFAASVDETRVQRLLDALMYGPIKDMCTDADILKVHSYTRADFALANTPRLAVTCSDENGRSVRISLGLITHIDNDVYAAVDGVDAVFTVSSNVFAAADLTANVLRRRTLFPVGPAEIASVDLKRGSGSFLRFSRDGDAWTIRQPKEAPASAARVKKLVDETLAARAVDFVWPVGATNEVASVSASLLAGYGLDPESAVTVTFKCIDGTDRWISFGKSVAEDLVYALAQNGGAIVTVSSKLRDQASADSNLFADTRLFPLESAQVMGFTLTDGKVSYMLARDADGSWRLDSPIVAPADTKTVTTLVGRLLELRTADAVTSGGVLVSLTTNSPPVMVAREAVTGGGHLNNLRSTTVLRIPRTEVKRLVVTDPNGKSAAVAYDRERKIWTVESPEGASTPTGTVSVPAVEGILETLESFRAERVERIRVDSLELGRYGLDAPKWKLAVDLAREESVRRNVLIGGETAGGRFVTIGSSDAVFVVAQSVIDRLTAALIATTP